MLKNLKKSLNNLSHKNKCTHPIEFHKKEIRSIHIPGPREGQTNYLPITVNTIWDNPGSRKKAIRTGRGPGSGKGYSSIV